MKSVLILGAGRSSATLINYLLQQAAAADWRVIVGDVSLPAAQQRVGTARGGEAIAFDINDNESSSRAIAQADVVVSLLPANFHPQVAKLCLTLGKHLLTASYVSPDMLALAADAERAGLLFLNECGLDPGIDHLSAMQVIDRIRNQGGIVTSFESFTGGLIAPETDPHNPWRYKFTWNARNVVMAGQSTAMFLQNGLYKYIPYQRLFVRTTPVQVPGLGDFEGYANRDSLKYIATYKLDGIKTMVRGTLRNQGYCAAWHVLVTLGCCDDTYVINNANLMTHADFISSFLEGTGQPEQQLVDTFGLAPDGPELQRLRWSGFFSEDKIELAEATPAQITEHILNKKWKLQPHDKDMIVMWHRFGYQQAGKQKQNQAWLAIKGRNGTDTAMAQTVGLPLGIAARLLLQGKISRRGVVIPTTADLYEPILSALREHGIELNEMTM
jgi:saccharopine dehydrogenase (NADP+, L-glutamate forming)